MDIILLQDVKTLGKKGEIIKVNDGYARNYIIPKKLGVEANSKNMNDLKLQKANQTKVAQEKLDSAKQLAAELADKKVEVKVKTGTSGRIFGAVSNKEVAVAIRMQLGIEIDKKKIVVTDSIKELGTYTVKIKLHPEVSAQLNVEVTAAE